jgi:uncharacterized protein (TIGR00251 family)
VIEAGMTGGGGRPPPIMPWHQVPGGLLLAVRLTPRAARSEIAAVTTADGTRPLLHIRLAAPPVDGAANLALVDLLARALSLRKRDVRIRSGQSARCKMIELDGDAAALAERLAAITDRTTSPADQ